MLFLPPVFPLKKEGQKCVVWKEEETMMHKKVYKRSTQQPSGCGRVGKTLIRKGKEKRAGKIPTLLSFFVSLYGKICNSTYSSKTTSDKKKSERETPHGFSPSLFFATEKWCHHRYTKAAQGKNRNSPRKKTA